MVRLLLLINGQIFDAPHGRFVASSQHLSTSPNLVAVFAGELVAVLVQSYREFEIFTTELQKCQRLIRLLAEEKRGECAMEYLNPGHIGWNPIDHPDWLLLEIEQDLLVQGI